MTPLLWVAGAVAAAVLLGGDDGGGRGAEACLDPHMPPDLRASTRKLLDTKYPATAYAMAADIYEAQGYPAAAGCLRQRAGGARAPAAFNPYEPATWGPLLGGAGLPGEYPRAAPLPGVPGVPMPGAPGPAPAPAPGPAPAPPEIDPGLPPGADPTDPATFEGQPKGHIVASGETPQYLASWYTGNQARWGELGAVNPHLGAPYGTTWGAWAPGVPIMLPGDWNPWHKDAPPPKPGGAAAPTPGQPLTLL